MLKNVILIFFFVQLNLFSQSQLSIDILSDGKWYNDEYSFTFKDNTFKAFYTFGETNGVMTGTITINKDNTITLQKVNAEDSFNTLFMTGDKINLMFVEDKQNPKSTRCIKDADENIVLWNDKSFVKNNQQIVLEPNKVKCISLGYELSSTTVNVRIRKGPGTNFEYVTFFYKDIKTNEIKSFGSVLEGTNIRVLARTVDKMQVNEWYNYWYFIEYKEPKNNLLVYKTAWMYGEFINVPENKNRMIEITEPENEGAYYGAESITITGTVTGAPVSMKIQIKNSYGNIISEEKITGYKQKDGTFEFTVSKNDDTLFIGSNIFSIVGVYSDKKTASKQITVYVHESQGEKAKPVIYLYPEKEMKVSVKVAPKNGISVSIPQYNNGWEVNAKPDGTLTDTTDGKKYTYLFWESKDYDGTNLKTGFIVKKENLPGFFKEKLSILGLNGNEIKDFLDYWIPVLNKGNYYFINFYDQKSIDDSAPLTVSPKPDTVIRIFFDSKSLDKPITVEEQKLTPVKRKGFTVTEWGGMKY